MTHNVLQPWRLTAWLQSTRLTILSRLHESRYAPAGLRWATVRMTHDGLQPAWITMCSSMQDSRHDTVCLTHDMLLSSWPTMCSSLDDLLCALVCVIHDVLQHWGLTTWIQSAWLTRYSRLQLTRYAPAWMAHNVLQPSWIVMCSMMPDSHYAPACMTHEGAPVTHDMIQPGWLMMCSSLRDSRYILARVTYWVL
jgi:hypothetical protein